MLATYSFTELAIQEQGIIRPSVISKMIAKLDGTKVDRELEERIMNVTGVTYAGEN